VNKVRFVFAVSLAIALIFTESTSSAKSSKSQEAVSGPFSEWEVKQFSALEPIDAHSHAYKNAPEFFSMFQRLNLHIMDILVDLTPNTNDLTVEREKAWAFIDASDNHVSLCTTFNPFDFSQPKFSQDAIREIDQDFERGAIAVKIWKNIGKEVKDSEGNYMLPDNPVFEPIYRDIAAHNKTLIAHLADPDAMWQVPNPGSPAYAEFEKNPNWYMYNKPGAPSKAAILRARDHILEENPNLRVVGAHLGSMESDFTQLGEHLDRYPNFAVDLADRLQYFVKQPRESMIIFIERYQDRLIYGTDNQFPEFPPKARALDSAKHWESAYAFDWRYLATNDVLEYQGHKVQGLGLPTPILRKLYHDNAVKWFPGILGNAR
jgi:predicted TIM-barrel fold metal-dependent hydrolase